MTFQSTLPVWGATDGTIYALPQRFISIHAPRVGSDHQVADTAGLSNHFNPRSPCGERPASLLLVWLLFLFQSTLPVWGATLSRRSGSAQKRISIHAPRVGSDFQSFKLAFAACRISIHAPRVGSDQFKKVEKNEKIIFQSTLPVWGATKHVKLLWRIFYISIHAPRVGSDRMAVRSFPFLVISIHAPRVGSDRAFLRCWQAGSISIHAPRVGSDNQLKRDDPYTFISIHAPRVGSDRLADWPCCCPLHFNPRSPCGERRIGTRTRHKFIKFQSTLPVWGATLRLAVVTQMYYISIHAPRVGSDED